MDFLFFDMADAPLFVRNDAESATWTVEEMSVQALFPFVADKRIARGQRFTFPDALGVLQCFEVRKVRTYEPDHYQEITAEHIVIAELSDEHLKTAEITEKTAAQALAGILSGTLWSVGNVTASGTSSGDISMGSVWQGVRMIEKNWNVYITPRVTVGAAGITGRYLDIAPAEPVWRGVRLSLDKNADEMGVTWDDTNVITAIYGYGGRVGSGTTTNILTFADAVWSETSAHPAKPAGQEYLEDPNAKALYGRNGRNRFGYYQNSDIKDKYVLLQKAWQALKASNTPQLSIDCQVRDLYRLGYADQPLQLHDRAIVDIRPTGESLQREIIRMTVDLLDPTATRVTIGAYIPNIVYIQRSTNTAARGRGGGGNRGGGGGGGGAADGQDNQWYEFTTSIQANQYAIDLNATHWTYTNEIFSQAGLSLNSQGVLVYATDNANMWQSRLNVQANRIGLVVEGSGSQASIKAASIVASINGSGSNVTISADKIVLDGETIATQISGMKASFNNLISGLTLATKISATTINTSHLVLPQGADFTYGNNGVSWQSQSVVTGVSITDASVTLSSSHYFLYASSAEAQTPSGSQSGYVVRSRTNGSHDVSKKTIYYLGRSSA